MKRFENIMIGGTRLGNPVEVMNAPGNEWTWIVWKFNVIVFPTMVFLELGWLLCAFFFLEFERQN